MNIVKKVAIIGAGNLGSQIAALSCKGGFCVEVFDVSESAIEKSKKALQISSIKYCSKRDELSKDCDLIIETVFENMRVKRNVLSWVDKYFTNSNVVICSNSSEFLPSSLCKKMQRKNRFCSYHFHSPSTHADIVDIMLHKKTDSDVPEVLTQFTKNIGLVPFVIKKEHKGYVFNTIFNEVIAQSISLAVQGIAKPEEIDRCWMVNTKMSIGPFGMIDLVGLDTVEDIMYNLLPKKPLNVFAIRYFKKYTKQNYLGKKTGQGFYTYPDPKFETKSFLE
jgi:3-hydroxybutyryl-CoA dehydrogenase